MWLMKTLKLTEQLYSALRLQLKITSFDSKQPNLILDEEILETSRGFYVFLTYDTIKNIYVNIKKIYIFLKSFQEAHLLVML